MPSFLQVTQVDLHRHFHALGAGAIEEVRIQRDKGFGFVRYSTHAEAAAAISMGNTQSFLCGRQIKVCLHDYLSVCKKVDNLDGKRSVLFVFFFFPLPSEV